MIVTIQELKQDELAMRLEAIRKLGMRGLVDPSLGTVPVQARLLCEDAMFYTPPRNKKQGTDRVKLDYNNIFHPLQFEKFRVPSIAKLIYNGNHTSWEKFASNRNAGELYNTQPVTPNEELHKAWRDERGRARKTRFVTLRPDQSKMRELVKASLEHVGWAKSGWLTGYLALGGTRAPEWVTRHGSQNGTYIDGLQSDNPYVELYNNTRWGRRKDEATRILNDALTRRSKSMRSFYEKTMELVANGEPTTWQTQQAALVAAT
ncbi:MAG: hypothetical protein EBR82_42050 [Caulobacteraceae bacterium]|nr:hypothetical protein [Caulobacteraceae bacterium]